MSVRDIRLKWPEAERKLATVGEIVVTRDSKPVARILPLDRLHLATMQVLGVHCLPTNDKAQARAARGLGFEAVQPR